MDAAECPVWFVGDLDDPWVASVGDVLPPGSRCVHCAGDIPIELAEAGESPRVLLLHRAWLSPADALCLERFRAARTPRPRVVLCVGPHVRHSELQEWSARGLVDAIVPEATAPDTVGRHVATEGESPVRRSSGPRPPLAVVSGNSELRQTLVESCAVMGYPTKAWCDWSEPIPPGPALWDVPLLESDWPRTLAQRTRQGPVVVLLGFASRSLVGQARSQGAAACLELPYDLLDLGHVLDRVTALRGQPAHTVPPPPVKRRATPGVPAPRGPVPSPPVVGADRGA